MFDGQLTVNDAVGAAFGAAGGAEGGGRVVPTAGPFTRRRRFGVFGPNEVIALTVLLFAIAIVVILIAFSIFTGYDWTPRHVTVHV